MAGSAKGSIAFIAVTALILALAATAIAVAQTSQAPGGAPPAPSATPAIPPQPAPPAAFQPGFLHQLKVWWDDSTAFIDRKIKETRGTVDNLGKKSSEATAGAADAAKGAAQDAATATQNAMKGAVDATKGAANTAQDAMKSTVEATKGAANTAQDVVKSAIEATKGAVGSTQDAMKGAVEITKNAATAVVALPNTRFIDMHERCVKAPNGASDCEAAAAAGCRGKGFAGGHPLDVRTQEKCDTTALQAGQLPGQHECPVETVVTRAMCQ